MKDAKLNEVVWRWREKKEVLKGRAKEEKTYRWRRGLLNEESIDTPSRLL